MYTCPLSLLLRFVSLRVSDEDRTLLSPSFVHVMSGCGLPVALQNKFKLFPSTTFSSDGAESIFGGTKTKQKRTNQNTYKYHKHSKGYKNCNLSMTTQLSMNEWINNNFIYTRLKTSVQHRKLIKNSQNLFYIFAVWEYWSENHLWELLLKRPKEFDVRISSGRLFHRRALL